MFDVYLFIDNVQWKNTQSVMHFDCSRDTVLVETALRDLHYQNVVDQRPAQLTFVSKRHNREICRSNGYILAQESDYLLSFVWILYEVNQTEDNGKLFTILYLWGGKDFFHLWENLCGDNDYNFLPLGKQLPSDPRAPLDQALCSAAPVFAKESIDYH